jgi:hypothetical protein
MLTSELKTFKKSPGTMGMAVEHHAYKDYNNDFHKALNKKAADYQAHAIVMLAHYKYDMPFKKVILDQEVRAFPLAPVDFKVSVIKRVAERRF